MANGTEQIKRQRSCIGCGQKFSKDHLMRIVRCRDGSVQFDRTGRVPGRGAYVCSRKCFDDAWKARKLQRALKMNVETDDAERIAADLDSALREAEVR